MDAGATIGRMPRSTPPANLKVERPSPDTTPYLRLALSLSLGAAVSLGITRFAYGLLLPPMRADLGWSYTLAGSMNTANAVGYLLGALAMSWLLQRMAPTRLFLTGAVLATVFMAASGFFTDAGGRPEINLQHHHAIQSKLRISRT